MKYSPGMFCLCLLGLSLLFFACNNDSSKPPIPRDTIGHDTSIINLEDTTKHHFVVDSAAEARWNEFMRVENLLEFHTRDTMKTDSTYRATLSMGKNITSAELKLKTADITEPGGTVKVRDTTQEVGVR